jgi:RNA polymerase sigma-70 factor (ECF subfamily)
MVRGWANGVFLLTRRDAMTTISPDRPPAIERFRDYLHLLARMQIDPRLRRDCDPSDIVQAVMLKANQGRSGFRGTSTDEMAGWLRQILANTLSDRLRDRLRARRDVRREVDLATSIDESSCRLAACGVSREPSPSAALVGKENAIRLAAAVSRLPELQRDAVILKHLEGRPLVEVANLLNRSPASVASLLRRGLARLREMLTEDTSDGR